MTMNISYNKSTSLPKPASAVLLFIITAATLIGGIFFLKHDSKLKKECTYKTTAIVSDIKENSSSDSDTYAPVFTYEYEGNEYTAASNVYSSNLKFRKGDKVEFYVKPGDPQTFYCPKEKSGKFFAVILFIVSGLCLLMAVLTVRSLINEKRYSSGY